jgi:hypothetical protein
MKLPYRDDIAERTTIETLEQEAPPPEAKLRPYQLHGFRLIDADGSHVGLVDWIWIGDASGAAEFIGTKLLWLRGSARAIPAFAMKIDMPSRTVTVDHKKKQIHRAPRHPIDRELTRVEKRAICRHYRLQSSANRLVSLKRFAA